MCGFAQQEGKKTKGWAHLGVLVAGGGPKEDLGTWLPVVVAERGKDNGKRKGSVADVRSQRAAQNRGWKYSYGLGVVS